MSAKWGNIKATGNSGWHGDIGDNGEVEEAQRQQHSRMRQMKGSNTGVYLGEGDGKIQERRKRQRMGKREGKGRVAGLQKQMVNMRTWRSKEREEVREEVKYSILETTTHMADPQPSPLPALDVSLSVPEEFKTGAVFTKINSDRKQKQVKFRLDVDQGQILWESKKYGAVLVETIKEFRTGSNAAYDLAQLGLPFSDLPRFISIIYIRSGSYKTLNVLAPTPEILRQWENAVRALYTTRRDLMRGLDNVEMREAVWQKMYWKGADAGGDNKLDLKEVENLCLRLNISAPPAVVKKLFDASRLLSFQSATDEGGSRKLIFVKSIKRRPEVDALYARICDGSPSKIFDSQAFEMFMKGQQQVRVILPSP
ncbi:Phospholipase [Salix suchowensis]|nr:Phospholipase [Salix suchowensis]